MSVLSSSPLNLTLDSSPSSSTKIGSYVPVSGGSPQINSLFNSPHKNTILWTPWPSGSLPTVTSTASSVFVTGKPPKSSTIHSDEIYDVSINSIIEYTQKISNSYSGKGNWYPMWLKPVDFAYLKDVGVYPNNRIIICRRFDSAVGNDLTLVEDEPISTLISWVPDGKDFLEISFGERWTEAAATLTEIFNSGGKDFRIGSGGSEISSGFGDYLAAGANAIPLPGFTEEYQRKVLTALGIIDEKDASKLPSGDPNLIKEAKQRSLVDYETAGSGLTCDINIEVECKWEQKFIGKIDPTLAWMDIVQTVLRFGTSPARFYLGSGNQSAAVEKFLTDFQNNPIGKVKTILKAMIDALGDIVKKVVDTVGGVVKGVVSGTLTGNAVNNVIKEIGQFAQSIIDTMVDKYKVRLMGVFKALTGSPSGPWHVSVGNPKRPIFCSGDMICDKVTISMGDKLAFNDLPSSITAKFSLKNARPLGLQEILSRYNTGYSRTATIRKTIESASVDSEIKSQDKTITQNNTKNSIQNGTVAQANNSGGVAGLAPVGGTNINTSGGGGLTNNVPNFIASAGTSVPSLQTGPVGTRVGSLESDHGICNPDANSSTPIVTDSTPNQTINVTTNQKFSTFDTGGLTPKLA